LNAAAETMTGWTQRDAQSQPLASVSAILDERTRQPVESPVANDLQKERGIDLGNHAILVAKDGNERPISGSLAPILDSTGVLLGMVLVFRDVTEQRLAQTELRHSAARTSAILEAALDCIITMDHQGTVVEFNPASERTFGYRRADVIGRELADLIVPPSLRGAHRHGLARYLATGEAPVLGKRIELDAMRSDGSQFPVELAITRIPTDGQPMFTAYLRDISDRRRIEQLRSVRLTATQHLMQAADVEEAALGVLRSVCENLGWDLGFFWTVKQKDDVLECIGTWRRQDFPATTFANAGCSRTFERGEGLPGRVWSSGRSAWILDVRHDPNFPRAASAATEGLHSAFACPILVHDKAIGVIEFFTQRIRETDAELLETMATVAGHVGQFIERRQAEEKLRRSERELTDFFENATIGLHWVGQDGTILRANRAELDMLGYVAEEYVGHNIAQFHVDDEAIRDILQRLQAREQLHDYPARMRCKDGSIRDVLIHSSVLAEEGRFVHTRCFTRDVTDQKRAEEAVRESEGRFRALMEQAPFSVQIFSPDGRTISVNRAWTELWGATLDDIAAYNVLQDPQLEARGVLPYIQRAFAGEAVAIPPIRYDPNETLPDLARHEEAVRWVSAVAYPLKNDRGGVREVALVHEDITARRQAEAALRQGEDKLRLLADTIPQLAWMAHSDGHIFWYNRRWYEYTGKTAEEMEGWGWQSVHDPAVLEEVLDRWQGSIASGEAFEMVFPLRGADQLFRPFLTRVNPLRDPKGRIVYWCGTNTDISDIKRMEEALRDADRRKDEFLATLAHELRNPLAPISNSLQVLKMPRVDAATAQQTRDIMERQIHHLVRLVDDLLDVSRVMRGKIELRKEPVELATVVARAVETAQPLIEAQAHRLDISLPDESLVVDADPVRLVQVVGNLLANAAKYTGANGHIEVSARSLDGDAVLRVRDNGIGIAPDMLPQVFELFVQAENAATRSQGGLGIGLTLVKNLLEMHDGTVQVHSAGLGKGCEFTIRLPLLTQRREEPAVFFDPKDAAPSSGHRLLVVDDNKDAAESLALLLSLQGHEVRVAYDGTAAIDVARLFHPALIFLDLGMPGMDGYEVLRRVRKTRGLENTVIAALTGWGLEEDRRRTADAGFDHHLVKPPHAKALEDLLASLEQGNR